MIVTTRDAAGLAAVAARHGVPCATLGGVGGDRLRLACGGVNLVDLPVARLHEAWTSLDRLLG